MKEKRILYALGQVDAEYIEAAAPGGLLEKNRKSVRKGRAAAIAIAAAILIFCIATALAVGLGFDAFAWIMGARPDLDPAHIQEQLEQGQWVYMNDDHIAVVIPESPVKLLLSDDAGETWRESAIAESQGMVFLGEWQENMQYRGGYIGFNGSENGYLVLTSGVAMNHQALRIFLTSDGGETWHEIGNPYSQHVSMITGAGFASEKVGFISYRYYEDLGPDIWWTSDGGQTWSKLILEVPEKWMQHGITPQSPIFEGSNGTYPMLVSTAEGEETIHFHTTDGGMTWRFDPENS